MTVKEMVFNQAEKVNQELKESLKNLKSVALSEVWRILQLVVANIVQIIETIGRDLNGPDKKAIAIEYINGFYDKIFLVIDVPFVPKLLEPIIHRYIKTLLMIMVGSSIDATVTIFKQTGIFLRKGTI